MKYLLFFLLAVVSFTLPANAQDMPKDSRPVVKGAAQFTMPQSVIDAEIDGSVMVGIQVEETGKPSKVVMMSSPSWPCGENPKKAVEELFSTITETMMKLEFEPAVKDGKPAMASIGLSVKLKNPKLEPVSAPVLAPVTDRPHPITISGGVLNGKATYLAKPEYPQAAKSKREAGAVLVVVLIDESGKVLRSGIVSGLPVFQMASREAACNSRFAPTRLQGQPVKISGTITYSFIP